MTNEIPEDKKGKGKRLILVIGIPLILLMAIITYYVTVPKTDDYVAKINGEKITQSELNKELVSQYGTDVLSTLITNKVIELEAVKKKITVSDKEIQAELDDLQNSYGGKEAFEAALESNAMTLQDAKDNIKTYLTTTKLIEPTIDITEKELKTYFKENKDTFSQEEQVQASHILVEDKDTAQDVEKEIKKGEDFAELASEYSTDTASASNGGNLGYFGKGEMDESFEKAAFSMKVDEISDPIKTDYGYHIIKVTGKKAAKEATFENSKDDVKTALMNEKINANYSTWLSSLYEDYEIENALAGEK
ncbi:peptidylprolyl isomerase [Viridibacillus arvi]|uniref:peptidylprolyl isomerase n=1 Tax=Viridibacillus arvi TaxID=263475 RepID=UPI00187B133C|nr:peptidylprolyl isomerase [Viridibacillus sp. JNUCC-6]QOV09911.1 peptidylprolyl isomerase [Viridibacillus sp. JNUCC-6]